MLLRKLGNLGATVQQHKAINYNLILLDTVLCSYRKAFSLGLLDLQHRKGSYPEMRNKEAS